MRYAFSFTALLLMALLLVGCGQKGPLYLPGDEEAAEQYDPSGDHERRSEEDQGSRDTDTAPVNDEE